MNDDFLTSNIIKYLPDWFLPIFRQNVRLCLPYGLSIRDADDIIRAISSDTITFNIEVPGLAPIERCSSSANEFLNDVHYLVFQNVPSEVIISFGNKNAWLYYDGDQRFSVLVASERIIRDAFPNSKEVLRSYYVEAVNDILLDEQVKLKLFDVISTIT